MKRISVIIFFVTLICTTTVFAQNVLVKYIAVVETMIDERSGAANDINKAEVAEITNEIRSGAVRRLPADRFNVMTTETVLSMGDAVLQECAEENCVIALGSKIGADYIARGVVSKFRQNFTVTVEIFDTEYGMLLATATVRTANLDEILEKTAEACAAMYGDFLERLSVASQAKANRQAAREAEATGWAVAESAEFVTDDKKSAPPKTKIKKPKRDHYFSAKWMPPITPETSCGWALDLEYGQIWGDGWFLGIDVGGGIGGKEVVVGEYDNLTLGTGLNFGYTYYLPHQLQLAYGGFVGGWAIQIYRIHGKEEGTLGYIGPFVKLRWRFAEVSYRGIMGGHNAHGISLTQDRLNGFGYISQLMLGVHFQTSRRDR